MPTILPRASGRPSVAPASLGQLGMIVLFVSISVIFIAASLAVLITHGQIGNHTQVKLWRSPEGSGLPWTTALSTALMLCVSWQLESALGAIRTNRFTSCLKHARWGAAGAIGFLI